MNVDRYQAQTQSQEVCGPGRIDPERVQRIAARLRTGICRAVSSGEDHDRQGAQAPGGWWAQRGVAGDGAEVVIYLGSSKDLSPANPLGRGVRVQSAASQ